MASAKSSFLQIFDDETKHADYKFQISNAQAKMSFADSQMGRPLEFKAGSYKFKYGATLASEYDLTTRFGSLETDVTALENDPATTNNAAAIAAETVARIAADAVHTAGISAEITRASLAEGVNATAVAAEATRAGLAEAANAAAVVSAASVAAAATAAEAARALAAEAALSTTIQHILSGADGGVIDSIAELLSHVNTEDATLLASIAALSTSLTALTARVDELTNNA
jgi:hypothetical protein